MLNWKYTAGSKIFRNIAVLITLAACQSPQQPQFVVHDATATGLDFSNNLSENADWNILNYMYLYNGGGVGAGDFNRDGLTDLFFVSNMEENKFYLNDGGLKFRDVTQTAGLAASMRNTRRTNCSRESIPSCTTMDGQETRFIVCR